LTTIFSPSTVGWKYNLLRIAHPKDLFMPLGFFAGIMRTNWKRKNGYRDVLGISLPLVASMGSITLMQFTDRIFLAGYSMDAISAALPAGIASFTAISFFMGVANYVNAFVAQYTGAHAFNRVGAALWQGIYFALFSAVILALFFFASPWLFDLIGHSPGVRVLEVRYFNILTLGAGLVVTGSALACFYTGRGLTWTPRSTYPSTTASSTASAPFRGSALQVPASQPLPPMASS
jgi:Na+-driven multidrug efflux pump